MEYYRHNPLEVRSTMRPSDFSSSSDSDKTIVSPLPAAPSADARAGRTEVRRTQPGSHFAAPQKPKASSRKGRRDERTPRNRRRVPLIVLGVIVALLVITYAGGAIIFSNVFYPGATIAGADVSLIGPGSAATRIRSSMNRYSLTIEGSGFSWTYEPKSADALFDADAAAQEVLDQNDALRWPVHLFAALTGATEAQAENETVDLTAEADFSLFSDSFDVASFEESLGAAVDSFNEGRSGTFDAASAYDAEAGAFTVDKARSNEKLNRDNIIAYAKLALADLDESASLDKLGDDAFLPLVEGMGDSGIQAACDAANELLGVNISIKMNGNEVATIGSAEVAQWITFDENLTPTINQEAVSSWASSLADGLDTVGTKRTYTREDGKQITVSGGTYGWSIDNDTLVQSVVEAVNAKQSTEIEVPTSQTGDVYNGQGQRDWGAYIDIDISEQHARYYDASGNLLWESGVITGNPNKNCDTPTGIYMLNRKARGITLRGPKDPETGEYKWESDVDYWMAFVGNSIGLHDATWQASSSFSNPNAYKSVGSHGCVNLPYDKAAALYDMISPGLCVIVHN